MRSGSAVVLWTAWTLGLGLAGTVRADEGPATPAPGPSFAEDCAGEIAARCAGVEAGQVAPCLAAHRAELGKPCRQALRRAHRVAAFRAACGADVAQACAGVAPGQGRIRDCLGAHQATLSPACRDRLAKAGKRKPAPEGEAVADEAAREDRAGIEPVPVDLPIAEEAPGEGD